MSSLRSRLTVLELLALVAATAPGLMLTRTLPGFLAWKSEVTIIHAVHSTGNWQGTGAFTAGIPTPVVQPFAERPSYWIGHVPYWSGPCLVMLTIAAMILSLRRPRPDLVRLARVPGVAAGLAVVAAGFAKAFECLQMATAQAAFAAGMFKGGWSSFISARLEYGWPAEWAHYWMTLPGLAGYSVALGWLILALSGRWSRARSASDRLGRALGCCWIAMALVREAGLWCFAWNY